MKPVATSIPRGLTPRSERRHGYGIRQRQGYDGDAKTDRQKMSFGIGRLDVRQPQEFLKLGEIVPKTSFQLLKFEYKTRPGPDGEQDVSELTLVNSVTHEKIVLVLGKR